MTQKKRRTKSSAGQRRSHHALKETTLNTCSKCKKAVQPHKACAFCGTYKEKVATKAAKTKNTK